MKNIKYIIFFFGVVILGISCEKVLDQSPEDRIDLENFFKNREDAESALIGAYDAAFRDLVPAYILNASLSAREMEHIGDIKLRPVQYRPVLRVDNDGGTGTIWVNSYRTLARINLLLEKLPDIPESFFLEAAGNATKNRKNEIEGEAKALRAWIYSHLALYWGDVPLILNYPKSASPSDNFIAKSPAADVWKQVEADLKVAEEKLPWNHRSIRANLNTQAGRIQSKARFTKSMAKLMLVRLAMQNREWQKAATLCDDIIKSNEYTLNPVYTQTFVNTPVGSQNANESILETQSVNGGFVNTGGIFSWEYHTSGRTQLTTQVLSNYEGDYLDPKDVRYLQAANVQFNTNGTLRGITLLKYYNLDGAYNSADPFNYVLGRLAEVHLLRAEALNEISYPNDDALKLINGLRARAKDNVYAKTVKRQNRPDTTVFAKGINPISFTSAANTIKISTQDEFRKFIRAENWRELAFEGQRWYNLRRWDAQDGTNEALKTTYMDKGEAGSDPRKLFFPIPLSELRVNPLLKQNEGYQ